MAIQELFFELIRIAIGKQEGMSRLPSETEWGELFKMAQKQSLVGVCFLGLHRLGADLDEGFTRIGMSDNQYYTWMGIAAQIQQRNDIMNQRCAELQVKLAADGYRSCILKGQGVAQLYGEQLASLRQSGDIDVWMDAERENVVSYVKRLCSNGFNVTSKHIEFCLFDDTVVEAHFVPVSSKTPILSKRVKKFYEAEKPKQMVHKVKLMGGIGIVAPDTTFQAIHILQHSFGHFLFEGIGMRQMMDYYFVIQQPFTDEEKASIVKTMKRLKLYRFAQGVVYILMEAYGAKDCFIPADEALGKRILKSVMEEGNFGKYDEKRDAKRMGSSWYRYWYHNFRMLQFFDVSPWVVAMSPYVRIHEYMWRKRNGYIRN